MRGNKVVGRIGGPDRTMNKLKEQIRVLHEAVSQELDLKKNILEETAEQASQILTRDGGNIRLELTEGEGMAGFMVTPIGNQLESEMNFGVFSGIGDGGYEYTVVLQMTAAEDEPDSLNTQIMLVRSKGSRTEVLSEEEGWVEADIEEQYPE